MERTLTDPADTEQRAWSERARTTLRRLAPMLFVASIVVATDQLTKAIVRASLERGEVWPSGEALIRLSHVENTGAAFGIFEGGGLFLVISSIVGAGAVLAYLLVAPANDWLLAASLALILGGAIGNLLDRVFRGSVTDFIDPTHYPAFNLADSAIVVGVASIALLAVFRPAGDQGRDAGS